MAESKYGKYIVTELKENIAEAPWTPQVKPAEKGKGGRLFFVDSEVAPGAFYVECVWVTPSPDGTPEPADSNGGAVTQPHQHDFDEVLAFFGTNPEDIHDLGAEVELWLGDEKHILTKSCMVFVPAGLQHCPLSFNRVDRPVFYFTSGPGKMYF